MACQGCGLLIDAVQMVSPVVSDEVQTICARKRVQVGIAVEPLRPFIFPAIFTDEGLRVTGMDVELIREITAALSKRCGEQDLMPVLHLVRFRNWFVWLNEGKVDLFVSAISANVPSSDRSGLGYSTPYFYDGGIGAILRRADLAESVHASLDRQSSPLSDRDALKRALAGLTVAVQEGTSAHLYAEASLTDSTLILCDSLPAAFESQEPVVDVILGKQPVLEYMVTRVRKDWRQLILSNGKPLVLTKENYAVVMAEESYRLRRFVNDVLFQLDASGRLAQMRQRWFEETYAYPRRAAAEGLPFDADNMIAHYDQGGCRVARRH
jgi:ABC-type amino acid transport substrate-binding protein